MKAFAAIAMTMTALVTLSTPAHAGDKKFYPGTECQGAVFEEQLSNVIFGDFRWKVPWLFTRPVTHSTTGAAYNNSQAGEMTIVCPIVRDVERTDGLGWGTLIFNALNTSATRSLTCVAQTFFKNDFSFGAISSNTVGPNTDWLDLPLLSLFIPIDGYMLIHCNLPRKDPDDFPSGLASYRIDE